MTEDVATQAAHDSVILADDVVRKESSFYMAVKWKDKSDETNSGHH